MKLTQYMQYLKILHDRYGGIDVKTKITFETLDLYACEYEHNYTDAKKPKYDKNGKCVVIHKDFVSLSFD